jgi:hypothetical protein
MKKIDIGQTITILANVGVIAGIAVLAYELRQNNEALDAQSRYNHAIGIVDFFADMSLDEDLSAIIVKGRQGLELTPTEELRLINHYLRIFTMWDWEFHEDRLGRTDAPLELWLTLIRETPDETGFFYPGMRRTWETQKERVVSRDFREFIDSRLADADQE